MERSTTFTRIATGRVSHLRLRTRLLIILMVISGLGLAGMSVAVWGLTRNQIYERVDADLYRGLDSWGLSRGTGPEMTTASNLPTEFMLVYFSPAGGYRMINTSDRIPDLPNVERDRMPHTVRALPIDPTGPPESNPPMFRIIAIEAPDGTITAVAKRLDGERRMLEGLAVILASISVIVLAMMGAAGTIYVRRALLPLKELENTAIAIGDGDINRRAPAWPRDTEYGRLSFAMNTMVSQLQETLEESRQKEEQMRRFVGDASHELRTPLTSVRGYTELYRAGATDDADMVLSKIDEESGRMKLLVEDLLALTRAEGSRLNMRDVDMLELVCSVADSARAAFSGRNLAVTHESSDILLVSGDPDRLHQVLLNLISNAFKHAGEDVNVTVTVRDYLDRVYVDVADDGIGMSKEDAAHIFERFYRADTSRNRSKSAGGSGLGLAITKSIVEQHGGAITVVSEQGVGTKFTVSLPKVGTHTGA
nr:sensor histidine kinase [Streptococcus thermophilus]